MYAIVGVVDLQCCLTFSQWYKTIFQTAEVPDLKLCLQRAPCCKFVEYEKGFTTTQDEHEGCLRFVAQLADAVIRAELSHHPDAVNFVQQLADSSFVETAKLASPAALKCEQ